MAHTCFCALMTVFGYGPDDLADSVLDDVLPNLDEDIIMLVCTVGVLCGISWSDT